MALGLGAVSNTPVQGFSKADANRYTTVVTNNDSARLLLVRAPRLAAPAAPAAPAGRRPACPSAARQRRRCVPPAAALPPAFSLLG